jgi:hypothetical protein
VPPYYMATHRFDRTSEGWEAYAEFRKLPQLVEVVSMENHSAILRSELTSEEWADIVSDREFDRFLCFGHLEWLQKCLERIRLSTPYNLLCVFREPVAPPVLPQSQSQFQVLGYDLIHHSTGVSALTNCGSGFPAVIDEDEITECGLIRTLERAKQIQRQLPETYPREPHAYCNLWAIFRASQLG